MQERSRRNDSRKPVRQVTPRDAEGGREERAGDHEQHHGRSAARAARRDRAAGCRGSSPEPRRLPSACPRSAYRASGKVSGAPLSAVAAAFRLKPTSTIWSLKSSGRQKLLRVEGLVIGRRSDRCARGPKYWISAPSAAAACGRLPAIRRTSRGEAVGRIVGMRRRYASPSRSHGGRRRQRRPHRETDRADSTRVTWMPWSSVRRRRRRPPGPHPGPSAFARAGRPPRSTVRRR